tara:strand:- start:3730 stop:4992 length:1263 start_codon:yes stop_codon:yes gene_type:complete
MLIFDQEPSEYTPAYNQSPWVVRESDASGTLNDWRMQVEVFNGNTPVSTLAATFILRFRANSNRRVVFDPSRVMQGFMSYDHTKQTPTYAPWGLCENSIQWYSITWKSQKYEAGKWVTKSQFTKPRKCLFNGVSPTIAFLSYNQNDYLCVQNAAPKALTSYNPTIRDIGSAESQWVHFLAKDEQAPISLQLTKYPLPNLQGTPLTLDPLQINPFGLSFTAYPAVAGNEFTRHRVRAGIGTRDFSLMASPPSFVGVQSYKVNFLSTGSATPLTFAFNITDCSKYTPIRLHWLNPYGGFDAYTFKLKSQLEESIKRETFVQQQNKLSTAGAYGYTYDSRGRTEYYTRLDTSISVSSDNLTDAEWNWLHGLVVSPVAFMEQGAEFVAITIEDKKWQLKRGVQDGVFQLELEFKTALADYTQAQ